MIKSNRKANGNMTPWEDKIYFETEINWSGLWNEIVATIIMSGERWEYNKTDEKLGRRWEWNEEEIDGGNKKIINELKTRNKRTANKLIRR